MNDCEYPCTQCEEEPKCRYSKKYRKCEPYLKWFRKEWRALRKKFARDVSNRHEEKGNDDK